eukprot:1511087-Pleurochrysis_carterae.AAC.2
MYEVQLCTPAQHDSRARVKIPVVRIAGEKRRVKLEVGTIPPCFPPCHARSALAWLPACCVGGCGKKRACPRGAARPRRPDSRSGRSTCSETCCSQWTRPFGRTVNRRPARAAWQELDARLQSNRQCAKAPAPRLLQARLRGRRSI